MKSHKQDFIILVHQKFINEHMAFMRFHTLRYHTLSAS